MSRMKLPKPALLLALVLYVVSAAVTYAGLSSFGGDISNIVSQNNRATNQANPEDEETLLSSLLEIDPGEAVDQPCPLNGKLYTNTERQSWEERRPLAVMVENSLSARPLSGLSYADIVFEAVAEGGVTRHMAMMYCGAQAWDVELAPVRSARVYFLELASSFNEPMYVHVGGANLDGPTDALQRIADWGWELENDINQFSVGYPTFVRDYNRIPGKELATEHTMVTTTELLWEESAERGWTNTSPERTYGRRTVEASEWSEGFVPWTFAEPEGAAGDVTEIAYDFWSGYGDYSVNWEFNPETGNYKRFVGGEPDIDQFREEQLEAANVLVYLTRERGPLNEKKHMLYDIIGTGDVLIFSNGNVQEATWIKKTRESEIQLKVDGEDAVLKPGLTWVSVTSATNEVAY